jgi:hypothetical protein
VFRRAPWWLAPAGVYVATLTVFIAWSPEARTAFPLDDAWIHRVYARALATGHGFAYNDAQEAGCTSPLWVILTAPAHWLAPLGTTAVVACVKLLGALCGGAAVAAVYRLARQLGAAPWAAAIAASLIAAEPALAFSALAGMEVALVVALWLWAVAAIHGQRWRAVWVLLGAMPVARPEAAVLVAACVVAIAARGGLRAAVRTPWLAAVALPSIAWVAFCEAASGHPLPTTFYVKGGLHLAGLAAVPSALVEYGWARSVALPIAGVIALWWCARKRGDRSSAALLVIGSVAFVAAVVATRRYTPTGYYWTRWTDPGVLGVAGASALGVALGLEAAVARRARTLVAALGVVVVASLPFELASVAERAQRFASDARVIAQLNIAPGEWIAANTPTDAVVAVNDAGAIRYFGNRTTLDLIGLNDADLTFGRIDSDALAERVDYAVIYPYVSRLYPWLRRYRGLAQFAVPPGTNTIAGDPDVPELVVIGKRP